MSSIPKHMQIEYTIHFPINQLLGVEGQLYISIWGEVFHMYVSISRNENNIKLVADINLFPSIYRQYLRKTQSYTTILCLLALTLHILQSLTISKRHYFQNFHFFTVKHSLNGATHIFGYIYDIESYTETTIRLY